MDIFNIKHKTAHKFIKNHLIKVKNSNNIIPRKIQTVGIIAEAKLFEAYDFTKKLGENLGLMPKDLNVLLYENVELNNEKNIYPVFSDNDFGLYGKIKKEEIKDFADTKFDLLINYCSSDNLFTKVLVLRSKAILKSAFYSENDEFYSITIKITGNKIDTFNEELAKYLNILQLIN